MIDDVVVGKDAAGFPVVSWAEDRGLGTRERIECRILRTADGELMFVARGVVRLGTFEEGRPWRMLQGFALKTAEEMYREPGERALIDHIAKRSPLLGAALRDGGLVLIASFRVGSPMHINCADAPVGHLQRLHAILGEQFVYGAEQGQALGWRAPTEGPALAIFDPMRSAWPDAVPKTWGERLLGFAAGVTAVALALALLAFLGVIIVRLVGRLW